MKANGLGADVSTYGDVGIQGALCDVYSTTSTILRFLF